LSNVTLVLWALAFLTCFGMEPDRWALVMRNDLQNGQERHAKQMVSCNGFNVEPYILDILVRNKFPAECLEENSDSFGLVRTHAFFVLFAFSGRGRSRVFRLARARLGWAQSVRTEAKVVKFSAFFLPFFLGCRWKRVETYRNHGNHGFCRPQYEPFP
jgi:hypothetical protein